MQLANAGGLSAGAGNRMTIFQFGQCSEGLGRAAIVLRRPSSAILRDVIQRYRSDHWDPGPAPITVGGSQGGIFPCMTFRHASSVNKAANGQAATSAPIPRCG